LIYQLHYLKHRDKYFITSGFGKKITIIEYDRDSNSWEKVNDNSNSFHEYEKFIRLGISKLLLSIDRDKYEKIRERQSKLFNDINELKGNKEYNKVKSETIIDWISMKLQHKIGERIGRGLEGVVYKYSKGKVIKITSDDVVQQYDLLNKNIRGIAKIYHTGLIEVP
jgi:hypothetical protein